MRILLTLAATNGLLAVALGAFGAHGLRGRLADLPDMARRLEWWQTGASYHLSHALAIGLAALLAEHAVAAAGAAPRLTFWAGWCFAFGILLFSGSLYVMGFTGIRALGAVTPLGGLAFLAGWALLVWAGIRG